jgi:hypothetical protein
MRTSDRRVATHLVTSPSSFVSCCPSGPLRTAICRPEARVRGTRTRVRSRRVGTLSAQNPRRGTRAYVCMCICERACERACASTYQKLVKTH